MRKEEEMGNFGANIDFLDKVKLLDKKQKILEIGSGMGGIINYLKNKGYKIQGIEPNQEYIKGARQKYGNLPIKQMSGDNLKFKDKTFDIVLSFDVFEHIKDTDKHLQEVRRVLQDGGFYIFSTPNKLTNIPWEILNKRSLAKWKEYHVALHTYWQLKKRLSKHGFLINFVDISIMNDVVFNKIKSKLGKFGLFLFKKINPDKFPLALRTNFYVAGERYVE